MSFLEVPGKAPKGETAIRHSLGLSDEDPSDLFDVLERLGEG